MSPIPYGKYGSAERVRLERPCVIQIMLEPRVDIYDPMNLNEVLPRQGGF